MKKIVIIGAGYVGLITAVCFARKGHKILLVENHKDRIRALLDGKAPFFEPGLSPLLTQAIESKQITFVEEISFAMAEEPELVFSCVGTPPADDGSADLSYVWQVMTQIATSLKSYAVIINKSTVPVSTARRTKKLIQGVLKQRGVSIDFDVASVPEFLREGNAVNDCISPDRVVVGVDSEKARKVLLGLYKDFLQTSDQFIAMNFESAEMTKYASNLMLATRISFMNQLSLFADAVGADIAQVQNGMSRDRRIGPSFLNAGIGYGGSCFPKDVQAAIHMAKEANTPLTIAQEVEDANQAQRAAFMKRIFEHYGPELSSKRCGIWGLSFKPDTDDVRCSPAQTVVAEMSDKCQSVLAYDPLAIETFKSEYSGPAVSYAKSAEDVLENSDFLIILTEWSVFKQTQLNEFLKLADRTIFDGRNCFEPYDMILTGISYFTVGRNVYSSPPEALEIAHHDLKERAAGGQ
ncbi:UDP-glucose/GDP-mannose dehydrogenase family protein [bacterium]|nr:UDP-glucose/GDP-mannose dehydrogenase family protein [bacterium]